MRAPHVRAPARGARGHCAHPHGLHRRRAHLRGRRALLCGPHPPPLNWCSTIKWPSAHPLRRGRTTCLAKARREFRALAVRPPGLGLAVAAGAGGGEAQPVPQPHGAAVGERGGRRGQEPEAEVEGGAEALAHVLQRGVARGLARAGEDGHVKRAWPCRRERGDAPPETPPGRSLTHVRGGGGGSSRRRGRSFAIAPPQPPCVRRTIKCSKHTVRTGVFVAHAVRYPINSGPTPGTHLIGSQKNTVRTEVFAGQRICSTRGRGALHYTTLHCTTLHYTTLHYTTLHCTALHCTALRCATPRCAT